MALNIKHLAQSLPATRPPFLVLAPVCVFLGTALSIQKNNELLTLNLVLALIASLCAAIAVNCLNEYQDFHSGLDLTTIPTHFSGGSGLLKASPHLAKTVLIIFQGSTLLLSLIGGYFIYLYGTKLLVLGLVGVLIIFTYTKYLNRQAILCYFSPGLGFGFLMTLGTVITQGGVINHVTVLISLIASIVICNLLLTNQFPDLSADKAIGRNHLAINYGTQIASIIYLITNIAAIAILIYLNIHKQLHWSSLISLIPLILTVKVFYKMWQFGENIGQHPNDMALNVAATIFTPLVISLSILFA